MNGPGIPMSAGMFVLCVAGLVLIVFITRTIFYLLPRRLQPRGPLERALRYAPLAALSALIAPEAFGWLLETLAAPAAFMPEAGAPERLGALFVGAMQDGRLPSSAMALAVGVLTRDGFKGLAAGAAVYLLALWLQ